MTSAAPQKFTFDLDFAARGTKRQRVVAEADLNAMLKEAEQRGYARGLSEGENSAIAQAAKGLDTATNQLVARSTGQPIPSRAGSFVLAFPSFRFFAHTTSPRPSSVHNVWTTPLSKHRSECKVPTRSLRFAPACSHRSGSRFGRSRSTTSSRSVPD